jgi:hypothetical protein
MRRRIAAVSISVLIAAGVSIPAVAHADTMTLNQLEAQLTVSSPNLVGYDRSLFGDWAYTTGDGCNTRANLLKAQSLAPVTFSSGCTVASGEWLSWYDNQTWTLGSQVQIDHLVPLAEAWASGASSWTAAQRSAFANDTIGYQLQVVTSSVNESKGDQDPTVWMPPAASAECQYIADWVLSKYRWSLTVDVSEQTAIVGYLAHNDCGAQTVTVPTVQVAPGVPAASSNAAMPVYRFWSPQNHAHFFTISAAERDSIIASYPASVWTYEGSVFNAFTTQQPGTTPMYRFYSTRLSGHFYTTSLDERNGITANYDTYTWNYEGVAYYVYPSDSTVAGTVPVARFWSPTNQHHFYTANATEAATVKTYPPAIFTYEGDAFRVPTPPASLYVTYQLTCSGTTGIATVKANNPNAFPVDLSVGYDFNGDGIPEPGDGPTIPAGAQGFQWQAPSLTSGSTGTVIVTIGGDIVYTKAFNVNCSIAPPPPPPPPPPPTQPANPGDTKNCTDFATHAQAQAWFNTYYPYYGDIAKLDQDNDLIACESLP